MSKQVLSTKNIKRDTPKSPPLQQTPFLILTSNRVQLLQELTRAAQVGPTTHLVASLILDECKAELDTGIKEMDEKLDTVGDDTQLAIIDLQDKLQKQQQVLQMLSSISKMLSDTAMAVIRKIGG